MLSEDIKSALSRIDSTNRPQATNAYNELEKILLVLQRESPNNILNTEEPVIQDMLKTYKHASPSGRFWLGQLLNDYRIPFEARNSNEGAIANTEPFAKMNLPEAPTEAVVAAEQSSKNHIKNRLGNLIPQLRQASTYDEASREIKALGIDAIKFCLSIYCEIYFETDSISKGICRGLKSLLSEEIDPLMPKITEKVYSGECDHNHRSCLGTLITKASNASFRKLCSKALSDPVNPEGRERIIDLIFIRSNWQELRSEIPTMLYILACGYFKSDSQKSLNHNLMSELKKRKEESTESYELARRSAQDYPDLDKSFKFKEKKSVPIRSKTHPFWHGKISPEIIELADSSVQSSDPKHKQEAVDRFINHFNLEINSWDEGNLRLALSSIRWLIGSGSESNLEFVSSIATSDIYNKDKRQHIVNYARLALIRSCIEDIALISYEVLPLSVCAWGLDPKNRIYLPKIAYHKHLEERLFMAIQTYC
jgi:hypothetical protein